MAFFHRKVAQRDRPGRAVNQNVRIAEALGIEDRVAIVPTPGDVTTAAVRAELSRRSDGLLLVTEIQHGARGRVHGKLHQPADDAAHVHDDPGVAVGRAGDGKRQRSVALRSSRRMIERGDLDPFRGVVTGRVQCAVDGLDGDGGDVDTGARQLGDGAGKERSVGVSGRLGASTSADVHRRDHLGRSPGAVVKVKRAPVVGLDAGVEEFGGDARD